MKLEKVRDSRQYLKDVVSWLVINSMRVDGIQFDLLCEQNVTNVWRKRAFNMLKKDYRIVDAPVEKPELMTSLQVFRERIDFVVENSVPQSTRYSDKVAAAIGAQRY